MTKLSYTSPNGVTRTIVGIDTLPPDQIQDSTGLVLLPAGTQFFNADTGWLYYTRKNEQGVVEIVGVAGNNTTNKLQEEIDSINTTLVAMQNAITAQNTAIATNTNNIITLGTEQKEHQENDDGYWTTMMSFMAQQQTTNAVLEDFMTKAQAWMNDPNNAPKPEITYDMTKPTTLKTPPLIGALFLEIGGVNNIGAGWTAPSDGLVVFDGASTIGLLTDNWIAVDGVKADPTSSDVQLIVLGNGTNGQVTIKAGQILTESGMGTVTFYPAKVVA